MNIFDIIKRVSEVDPEVYGRLDSRRDVFKHLSSVGKKAAAAALPLAFGATINKAYAGSNRVNDIFEVLNYALTLEHLESDFYSKVHNVAYTGISTAARGALDKIMDDEAKHVAFLTAGITAAGGTPVSANAGGYDYTAGGALPNPLDPANYGVMLAVAQAFEDTGVRAYKGRAGDILDLNQPTYLQYALQIHSVEARHAAHIRSMRRALAGNGSPKSWVEGGDAATNGYAGLGLSAGAVALVDKIYGAGTPAATFPAESNTTQGGVQTKGLANTANGSEGTNAAAEAFDEGLDKATVLAIATPFLG